MCKAQCSVWIHDRTVQLHHVVQLWDTGRVLYHGAACEPVRSSRYSRLVRVGLRRESGALVRGLKDGPRPQEPSLFDASMLFFRSVGEPFEIKSAQPGIRFRRDR